MSIAIASNIIDGKNITVSAHDDVTDDLFEAIRNNDTTPKDISIRYRKSDATHVYPNVQPGDTIPVEANRLFQTGTTALSVGLLRLN